MKTAKATVNLPERIVCIINLILHITTPIIKLFFSPVLSLSMKRFSIRLKSLIAG